MFFIYYDVEMGSGHVEVGLTKILRIPLLGRRSFTEEEDFQNPFK